MHVPVITNRYSDGSVGVVHSAVCGSSKFKGTRTYFEKVGVVQWSNAKAVIQCEADILQG